MPIELLASVDSLDAVEEPLRPFYRPTEDGKFNLIDPGSIDKLEGTLSRTKAERDQAKEAAKEVQQWKDLGLKPDEIKALKQERDDRATSEAEKKGEWDKLKVQMEDHFAKERDGLTGKIGTLTKTLERKLIDSDAVQAIAELKGEPTLLLPHVRSRVKVEEKDGDYVPVVLTADGKGPMLNAKNEPMTVKELVESMREDKAFGRAFEGSGHSGGGGTGGGSGGGGSAPNQGGLRKSTMTIPEKTKYMEEHGPEAFRALPL
jgi:hypothetical protein